MICLKFKLVNSLRVQKKKIKKTHCRSFQIPRKTWLPSLQPLSFVYPPTSWKFNSLKIHPGAVTWRVFRTHSHAPGLCERPCLWDVGLVRKPWGPAVEKQPSQNWVSDLKKKHQNSFVTASKQDPNYKYMGVSKNKGTPKWMVYNGKP